MWARQNHGWPPKDTTSWTIKGSAVRGELPQGDQGNNKADGVAGNLANMGWRGQMKPSFILQSSMLWGTHSLGD